MISLLLLTGPFLINGQSVTSKLSSICEDKETTDANPNKYETWTNVDDDDWYWGYDWEEFVENGTILEGVTGSDGLVHPAGFRNYVLAWYNEPPICMRVTGARDRKVEILLESELENANLCIHDASDDSVGNNNVGNVDNCGSGKLYACFTAATDTNDFGFYVYCSEGCEDTDMNVWMRIRVSTRTWNQDKKNLDDDLEHWCEYERGTNFEYAETGPLYYTYPSDLVPDEPSDYPFHINHIFGGKNAGSLTRPNLWLSTLMAGLGLLYLLA